MKIYQKYANKTCECEINLDEIKDLSIPEVFKWYRTLKSNYNGSTTNLWTDGNNSACDTQVSENVVYGTTEDGKIYELRLFMLRQFNCSISGMPMTQEFFREAITKTTLRLTEETNGKETNCVEKTFDGFCL